MQDDHASGAINAYGISLLETPNIDKLADQSMRFNNCFNVAIPQLKDVLGKTEQMGTLKKIDILTHST